MAYTDVKSDLDRISETIQSIRKGRAQTLLSLQRGRDVLDDITTTFATTIAEVTAYVPNDDAEAFAKAESSKLQSEWTALRAQLATDIANMQANP